MGSLCPPEARPPGTVISYWQQSSNSWKRYPQKITPFKGNFLVPSHLGTFQICLGLVKSLLLQELADPIDQAMRAGVTCCRPATLTIPNTWVMWYHLKSSPVEVWHNDKPWFGIFLFMASNLYSSCLIFRIPRHGMSQKWGALFGFQKCALGDKKGHLILRHPHISIFSTVHALWPVVDPDHEADPEDLPQKQLEKIQDNKRVVYLNQFAILYGLVMDYIYNSRKCLRRGWGWLQFFYLLRIWSAGYMWGGLPQSFPNPSKRVVGFLFTPMKWYFFEGPNRVRQCTLKLILFCLFRLMIDWIWCEKINLLYQLSWLVATMSTKMMQQKNFGGCSSQICDRSWPQRSRRWRCLARRPKTFALNLFLAEERTIQLYIKRVNIHRCIYMCVCGCMLLLWRLLPRRNQRCPAWRPKQCVLNMMLVFGWWTIQSYLCVLVCTCGCRLKFKTSLQSLNLMRSLPMP